MSSAVLTLPSQPTAKALERALSDVPLPTSNACAELFALYFPMAVWASWDALVPTPSVDALSPSDVLFCPSATAYSPGTPMSECSPNSRTGERTFSTVI